MLINIKKHATAHWVLWAHPMTIIPCSAETAPFPAGCYYGSIHAPRRGTAIYYPQQSLI